MLLSRLLSVQTTGDELTLVLVVTLPFVLSLACIYIPSLLDILDLTFDILTRDILAMRRVDPRIRSD